MPNCCRQLGPLLQIITFATDTKNVVATCVTSDLLKTLLPHLMEQLELCQKSLSAYLEAKRAEFPRFYFVSDPTLLEILSLGSDPPSVVPHFQSGLFDSLTNVTFDKVSHPTPHFSSIVHGGARRLALSPLPLLQGSKSSMTEMWSQQGERVPFETPVEAKGDLTDSPPSPHQKRREQPFFRLVGSVGGVQKRGDGEQEWWRPGSRGW